MVNGRRTDIPSMLLKPGDRISVRQESQKRTYFTQLADQAQGKNVPMWLERDLANLAGGVIRPPDRSEIDGNLNEQLIVEYYSR
jgi:small subunit ribosomal protein S4